MKAYKFINVGGKTFYFNVNESKGGNVYLAVTAKQGAEPVSEKIVLFPNQIPSFLHCFIDTYAEICRKEGMPVYFDLPFQAGKGPEQVEVKEEVEEPEELDILQCPRCERKPARWYEDQALDAVGSLHVYRSDETGNFLLVKCQGCGWAPPGFELNKDGYAVLMRGTKEFSTWVRWEG